MTAQVIPEAAVAKDPRRCHICGLFMRRDYRAPNGYACNRMTYSHHYGSWEHQ